MSPSKAGKQKVQLLIISPNDFGDTRSVSFAFEQEAHELRGANGGLNTL